MTQIRYSALDRQTVDKKRGIQYRISPRNLSTLKELKMQLNLGSLDSALSFVLSQNNHEYPAPTPTIVGSRVPAIITGLPNSGKTTFLNNLVKSESGPCLVLDIANEYQPLINVNLGEIFALDWHRENRKLRFVPNKNAEVSHTEADAIFRHLIMFQGDLARWLIVIEEGHRFKDSDFLKSLMAEARKFTRKLIVVSHQPEPFNGLGEIFKVNPWNGAAKLG